MITVMLGVGCFSARREAFLSRRLPFTWSAPEQLAGVKIHVYSRPRERLLRSVFCGEAASTELSVPYVGDADPGMRAVSPLLNPFMTCVSRLLPVARRDETRAESYSEIENKSQEDRIN